MRRRHKYDLYLVIILFIVTAGYFIYNQRSGESRGINNYSEALKVYKNGEWEQAYALFAKVPYTSSLKQAALFRQARCATNLDRKELAIKNSISKRNHEKLKQGKKLAL